MPPRRRPSRQGRPDAPGAAGTGIEFWVEESSGRWCEQVKDAPAKGPWTINRLINEGVLSSLARHLANGHQIRLVLSTPATALDALASRARAAKTLEEYREILSQEQAAEFERVAVAWAADEEVAWEYLRRVHVEHLPLEQLRRLVHLTYERLVQGDPDVAVGFLRGWLNEVLHQTLTAPMVWGELQAKGFSRRLLAGDPDTLAALKATVDRHRRRIDAVRPALGTVHQPHTARLVDRLVSESARQVLVLHGRAGSGKSTVAADAVRELTEAGWFAAALGMDVADTRAQTAVTLGRAFDLVGSPVVLLDGVADGSPAVLLVDQLDAVSTYSGRMPDSYDGVAELLEQAASLPNIWVVLVVRTVDLAADPRLQSLLSDVARVETLEVGDLELEDVQAALRASGVDPAALTGATLQLLRVPLHLAVFGKLSRASQSVPYRTLPDLYQEFTDEVRRDIERRVGSLDWTGITGALVRWMSDREALHAPEAVLDAAPRQQVGALTSRGVLTTGDGRVGFFHETYFDFLFARAFVGQGRDLHDFLVDSGQHLFRRAQTRQVLEYLAAHDRHEFRTVVAQLLTSDAVRTHLQDVVVTVLRQLDAHADDWRAVEPLAFGDTRLGSRLIALLATPRWFDAADAAGRWEALLADASTAELCAHQLVLAALDRPERVEQLVRPHIGTTKEWRQRLRTLVGWSLTPSLADLGVELIERGELDDDLGTGASGGDFWSIVYGLLEEHPATAARLIGAHLRRSLVRAGARTGGDPFASGCISTSSSSGESVIKTVAAAAPSAFVRELLPFVVDVAESTAVAAHPGDLRSSARWRWRHLGTDHGVDGALFTALESALGLLARKCPRQAAAWVQVLAETDVEQLRFLACRTYSAAEAGNDAIDWLVADQRNLELGWSDSPRWASRELVEVATRHCDDEHLEALTELLLDHQPDWERTAAGLRARGRAQYDLLSAVEPSRRSDAVRRRLGELGRKFPDWPPAPPRAVTAHFVGPPIPSGAAPRMTDEHWTRAVRKYRSDGTDWSRGDLPVGGAAQLAQLMGTQAEAQPERFARLALTLDADTHPAYLSRVIEVVAGKVPVPLLAELCSHARRVAGQAVGRAVCDAVETVGTDADDTLLGLLEKCATDDDPDREAARTPAGSGQYYYGGDLLTAGLNSTRGVAARTLAHLLFARPEHAERLTPTVAALAVDPILAVRTWAAEAVIALMNSRPRVGLDIAAGLFRVDDADVFDSSTASRLLRIALIREPQTFAPHLRRALQGPESVAERAGQVWAVAFVHDLLTPPVPTSLPDLSVAARRGAAAAFAEDPTVAPGQLVHLFDDDDPKVREAAATAVRAVPDVDPSNVQMLVASFISSAAFEEHFDDLFYALERSTQLLPEAAVEACQRAVEIARQDPGDRGTRRATMSRDVTSVVLRLYRQGDAAIRARCLDVIDQLTQMSAYGLEAALAAER